MPEAETLDQDAVIAFLSRPESYGATTPVERVDTHISVVFLVDERAYKLKRAVRFPYVDFLSPESRRRACEKEVALNRRTAPALYEAVLPVTREKGGALALGGGGEPVDWLVVMRRFDEDGLFDRLAERHALTPELMEALAEAIARFHEAAEPRRDHGGERAIRWVVEANAAAFARHGARVFDPALGGELSGAALAALERHGALLEARRVAGRVRHCHGDLHLRNICLFDARPTLFDAIEFNEDLACIDVLYDLAFLLMDLEHRGLRPLANRVLNRYLSLTGDYGGVAALPLFLSCRAGVRAQTSAEAALWQTEAEAAQAMRREAGVYQRMALDFLRPPPAALVAVGGLSATGKTTLARDLAPGFGAAPGALVLRSDVIRKALMGVDELSRLDAAAYRAEVTDEVYRTLCRRAAEVARAGHAVIADAVFGRPRQRHAIARAARDAGVAFVGLWLEAPAETLEARIAGRFGDASDATLAVLRQQLRSPVGEVAWSRLDASGGPEATAAAARARIGEAVPGTAGDFPR